MKQRGCLTCTARSGRAGATGRRCETPRWIWPSRNGWCDPGHTTPRITFSTPRHRSAMPGCGGPADDAHRVAPSHPASPPGSSRASPPTMRDGVRRGSKALTAHSTGLIPARSREQRLHAYQRAFPAWATDEDTGRRKIETRRSGFRVQTKHREQDLS